MTAEYASLVVSIIGLALTLGAVLFSAYHQYWKKADLRMAIGDRLRSFRGSNAGHLVLSIPITLTNQGAQVGALVRMTGEVSGPAGSTAVPIRWDRFEEAQEVVQGGQFKTRYGFAGYPDALLVPGRSAVPSRIQFRSEGPFTFSAGDYQLTISGFADRLERASATACIAFTMTPEMITRWEATLGEPNAGQSKGAIDIVWRSCYR